jgi:hypothetical protein
MIRMFAAVYLPTSWIIASYHIQVKLIVIKNQYYAFLL